MVIVLVFALAIGLGVPAFEVYTHVEPHTHAYVVPGIGGASITWENADAPFWPRYARRLAGQSWEKQPLCGVGLGRIAETCSYQHPEIDTVSDNGEHWFGKTIEMQVAEQSYKPWPSRPGPDRERKEP